MAKLKKHKSLSVDAVQKRREGQNAKKALNPFEVHINKEKMRVLGKKSKNERGLPGIARAKAIQKRKHTLLNEYKLQNKANKFMDRRIGERGHGAEEDKIMARFAAIRAKNHNKKSIFNLADDEVLTHKGQSLTEIERFENPQSDEDESDDEDNSGKLDKNFVKDAHFGGGMFRNTGKEGAKTHKQLIEQLIEESKKRKAEKQKTKEATLELTEKLDTDWKDLVQLVSKTGSGKEEVQKPKLDEYDKLMRELKFEARGTVSDRLKTEDEIAKEEKEKLEKLEQERLERMKGFTENNQPKVTHRSADDLDDDFVYESDGEENMLTYDDQGQSNVEVKAELNGKVVGQPQEESALKEDSDSGSGEEDEEEEEGSESDDSLADLKENESSGDESEPETKTVPKKRKQPKTNEEDSNKKKNKKQLEEEEISRQKELEKAGNELPFTFKLPESYESLLETLQGKSPVHQNIILERMIKCNHPSHFQGNKTGLGLLFAYVLQYINDLFSEVDGPKELIQSFEIFSSLMPQIYDLAHLNKENAHNSIVEVIKEKHQEFRKHHKKHPGLETLVFFKLVSLLFSTSDFRHQIVTPCFVFMEQILKSCKVKVAGDVAYGLFICTLVLEFTALSNRFLPAAINFLGGVLHMAVPKNSVRVLKVLPPFNSMCSDLVLTEKVFNGATLQSRFNISNLIVQEFTNDFKVSALLLTLKLLSEFKDSLKGLSSCVEIFTDVEMYLERIPMDFYPEAVKSEHRSLAMAFSDLKSERKLQYLVMSEKKPKALKLYDPKIVAVYDGKRRKVQSKEKAERDKLLHKLKKETKGALREIRRDKSFLGRVKINQKIKSDQERIAKVNRIYAEAASQQNELKTLDRQKKRK